MSSDLTPLTLAEICTDVSYGYTESATTEQVGPKFLRITDIQGGTFDWTNVPFCPATEQDTKKYKLEIGDIVVARTGNSTGENAQVFTQPPPAVFASYLIRFRPDVNRVNPFFVGYQLRTERFRQHVLSVRGGSAQPGANAKQLGTFPIQLIDRGQQDAVVNALRAIDDRTALLRQTNNTLESIAQAIFKSWFVDFDPVRAKMEGRHPEGMDEETAALFPDSFEKSDFGLVPNGWHWGNLDDLSTLNPESWTAKKHPDTLNYVDLSNTKENIISGVPALPFEAAPSRARRVLRTGDSIVGTVRPGNKSYAFIGCNLENLTGSTGFAVLRPKTLELAEFIYISVTREPVIEHLAHIADGGAYPAVRPEVVAKVKTVLPSDRALKKFHQTVSPLFESVANNQSRVEVLTSMRDNLLPRLISGQIRLPEVQEQVENALQ